MSPNNRGRERGPCLALRYPRRYCSSRSALTTWKAAPPVATSEAAWVCISWVTAKLAVGTRSETCDPDRKVTNFGDPAAIG